MVVSESLTGFKTTHFSIALIYQLRSRIKEDIMKKTYIPSKFHLC